MNDLDDAGISDVVVANNALFCSGGVGIRLGDGAGPAVFSANAVSGSSER